MKLGFALAILALIAPAALADPRLPEDWECPPRCLKLYDECTADKDCVLGAYDADKCKQCMGFKCWQCFFGEQ
ncbi:hypothetical protein HK102_011926 [Quaeritorhiza haematococci]|nr:hypothetical protein HK102_011926 [Quaeritorhiza haematococci]